MVIGYPTNSHFYIRIVTLSKIFPTMMLYKLWEDGKVNSLDDPLEKYVKNFTIKNPLGKETVTEPKSLPMRNKGKTKFRSSITLRRMASQLSGTKI